MPSLGHRPHTWKKVSLIVFRHKFYQNLACGAHFQFSSHDLFEKVVWKMLFENCLLFFIFNFTCCKFFALKKNHYSKQTNHLEDFPHGEIKISCWIKISHIGNLTYWEKRYISPLTFRQLLKKILPAVCIQLQLWLIWISLNKTKLLNKKQCPEDYLPE